MITLIACLTTDRCMSVDRWCVINTITLKLSAIYGAIERSHPEPTTASDWILMAKMYGGISFVMLPSGAYNLKLNPSRTSTTLGHPTILLLIIIVQLARSPTIHLLRSIKTINIDPIPIENPALTFFNLPIIPIIVPRTKVVTNKTLTKISRSVQRDRRGSAKEIEEDPVGEGGRFQETQVALRVEPFG